MFNLLPSWFGLGRKSKRRKQQSQPAPYGGFRRLRLEPLEDRRMLAVLTVSTNADSSAAPVDNGILELREAIAYVNQPATTGAADRNAWIDETADALGTNDTIVFDPNLNGSTITLTQGELLITNSVVISSRTPLIDIFTLITIDASGNDNSGSDIGDGSRVFDIDLRDSITREEVRLDGLTIRDGDSSGEGGGIRFRGSTADVNGSTKLIISNSFIRDNHSHSTTLGGGGISIDIKDEFATETVITPLKVGSDISGVLIVDTFVTSNSANEVVTSTQGGGIRINAEYTKVEIRDSFISGNDAAAEGGGLYASLLSDYTPYAPTQHAKSQLEILRTDIANNESTNEGGGLHVVLNGDGELEDGGSLHAIEGEEQLRIINSLIRNNDSDKGGGAYISTTYSSATIVGTTFRSNRSLEDALADGDDEELDVDGGGGLYLRIGKTDNDSDNKVTITGSVFENNNAIASGGGIYAAVFGIDSGTGGAQKNAAQFILRNSTISGNDANTDGNGSMRSGGSGGGVFVRGIHSGTFLADHNTFSGNSASEGGGLAVSRATRFPINGFDAKITHSTFTENQADYGGGIYSGREATAGYDAGYLSPVNADLNHVVISGNKTLNTIFDPTTGVSLIRDSNLDGIFSDASDYNHVGPTSDLIQFAGLTGPFDFDGPGNTNQNIEDSDNDPELASLAYNGGGGFARTRTHLPTGVGGGVIDRGDQNIDLTGADTLPGTDDDVLYAQRDVGFERVSGTKIDIGAVEFRASNLSPRVVDVVISGTASQQEAFSFGRATYDNPTTPQIETDPLIGTGHQLNNVPVGLADTVTIHFDEQVDSTNISETSLWFIGLRSASKPTLKTGGGAFALNDGGYSATWQFENVGLGDHYLINLDDAITDLFGNQLDGEWTNPQSTTTSNSQISKFPSGDGNAGGNFNFVALILPGDINLDGEINVLDATPVFSNWTDGTGVPVFESVFGLGDITGDGLVNVLDIIHVFSTFGTVIQEIVITGDTDGDYDVDFDDSNINILVFQLQFGIDLDVVMDEV